MNLAVSARKCASMTEQKCGGMDLSGGRTLGIEPHVTPWQAAAPAPPPGRRRPWRRRADGPRRVGRAGRRDRAALRDDAQGRCRRRRLRDRAQGPRPAGRARARETRLLAPRLGGDRAQSRSARQARRRERRGGDPPGRGRALHPRERRREGGVAHGGGPGPARDRMRPLSIAAPRHDVPPRPREPRPARPYAREEGRAPRLRAGRRRPQGPLHWKPGVLPRGRPRRRRARPRERRPEDEERPRLPHDGRREPRRGRRGRLGGAQPLAACGPQGDDARRRAARAREGLARRGPGGAREVMNDRVWMLVPAKAPKDLVTAALESGFHTFVVEGDADLRGLARVRSLRLDASGVHEGDRLIAPRIDIRGPQDQSRALDLAGKQEAVLVNATDWRVIPYENLIAAYRRKGTRLIAIAKDVADAKLLLETLETGVDVVLLPVEHARDAAHQLAGATGLETLVEASVTAVRPVGLGDRACLDTASLQIGRASCRERV